MLAIRSFGFHILYAAAGMLCPAQNLQAVKIAHTFQSMRSPFPGHLHLLGGILMLLKATDLNLTFPTVQSS